jgi:hypothetical protein
MRWSYDTLPLVVTSLARIVTNEIIQQKHRGEWRQSAPKLMMPSIAANIRIR